MAPDSVNIFPGSGQIHKNLKSHIQSKFGLLRIKFLYTHARVPSNTHTVHGKSLQLPTCFSEKTDLPHGGFRQTRRTILFPLSHFFVHCNVSSQSDRDPTELSEQIASVAWVSDESFEVPQTL